MKRKICIFLSALAISAVLAAPAAAQQLRTYIPGTVCTGASTVVQPCPNRPEASMPSDSGTPSRPEAPSAPDIPSVPDSGAVLAEERAVVSLVNEIRVQYGLAALTIDESLCSYARVKSQDMHDSRYFDHNSPTHGSPFDMMRSFGISYAYAGENIAQGYVSAEAVVDAWMNSAGHRTNILSADFTSIGVGYVADGGYWTQWFLG